MNIPSTHRVIAIGDIHGCSTALATVLEAIQPLPDDWVIPLGDVLDYGPDSQGVLAQLKALRERTRLTLLTGNHEEMLFNVLDLNWDPESWTRHGGDATLASYDIDHPRDLPAEDLAFLRTAKPYFETDTHAFVHAGYFPNQPLAETPSSALFWEFLEPNRCWPHYSDKTVVVGHTPQLSGEVLDLGFVVCIDTDCSRGNWLTALDTRSASTQSAGTKLNSQWACPSMVLTASRMSAGATAVVAHAKSGIVLAPRAVIRRFLSTSPF